MAGLQRSAVSFRRQGSSGLVWDDRFLTEELNQTNLAHHRHDQEQEQDQYQQQEIKQEKKVNKPTRSINTMERNRSNGGQRGGYRTGGVSPAIEPPSPKVSACGFCEAFGKPPKNHRKKAGKGRSR